MKRFHLVLGCVGVAVVCASSSAVRVRAQPAPPAIESFSTVPGARISYSDSGGAGEVVVFLHAATGSRQMWQYQRDAFTKAGFRMIAYDRRGFGGTTLDPAGPQPGAGADDLERLMTNLGIQRFHLVATAAGGFVAIDFALSFPDRLQSLVVANSIGAVQDDEYLALGRRLRPEGFTAMPPDFRELSPSYRAANREGTERWLALVRTNRPPGTEPVVQTMKNRVTFKLLESIRTPTLLLTGDADLYTPPSVLRMFRARIKGAEALVIAESGHSAFWEQPEIFNRTVLDFIRRH